MGGSKQLPYFVLLVHTAFALPIELSLPQVTFSPPTFFLLIIFPIPL